MIQFARIFAALLILTCLSSTSWAGRTGPEFQVNTYTASNQDNPGVADLAGGGFVVTWQSNGQDGSGNGVYGQRYDAAGNSVGGEFKVNKTKTSNQDSPSVAGLGDGGFVVTWASLTQDSDQYGVYGQRYDAAGKRVGKREFRVNKTTAESQDDPSVAGLGDGGFVVTWESNVQDGDSFGVYGQRYDAAGNRVGKREFQINKYTTSIQRDPSVAGLGDGGFVATWQSLAQDGGGWGVYGQRYDAAGNRVGKREFRVNKTTASNQYTPSVAGLGDGGFVIAWASLSQDGSNYGVYGQQYDAAGNRVGKREFLVNKTTASIQEEPSVAGLVDGGFVVAWKSFLQDGDNYGVYGQRYDAAGNRVAKREFMVNTYTTSIQDSPSVAGLGGGGFVVTWASEGQDGDASGIYGQRYRP